MFVVVVFLVVVVVVVVVDVVGMVDDWRGKIVVETTLSVPSLVDNLSSRVV